MIINEGQVLAEVARWAIRQSPYYRPDNLETVIDKLHDRIGELFANQPLGFMEISQEELRDMLKTNLRNIPEYIAWNDRKNGNDAPLKFTSRYDLAGDPDDDFIDLDALEQNIVRELAEDYARNTLANPQKT